MKIRLCLAIMVLAMVLAMGCGADSEPTANAADAPQNTAANGSGESPQGSQGSGTSMAVQSSARQTQAQAAASTQAQPSATSGMNATSGDSMTATAGSGAPPSNADDGNASAQAGGQAQSPATTAAADPATTSSQEPAEIISLTVEADREHQYDDATNWLCLPGSKDELCTTDLDATIVNADGTTELQPHVVADDPQFDCFYVYPTVSNDRGSNSDLNANQDEIDVVRAQAARYTRHCRLFAPLYRQVTLGALNTGGITDEARNMGYLDVVAAFNRYLTEYNQGRGFVLIGHSQGSGVLRRLLADEIDGNEALRKRFIAAHLLGTSFAVPEGKDVGGALQNIPVCRANDQFGCVVAYATFRANSPPPSNSRFGKVADGRAACANPAALGGGKGVLTPYFFTDSQAAFSRGQGERIATSFITMPDFLEAECVDRGEFTYLALTVLSDPSDPRADDISGDITADWGLHMVDVHIAMGTLVELAASEYQAYAAQP